MGCEYYEELISAALDDELRSEEQAALDAHLADCENCRAYAGALAAVSQSLQEELSAPPELLSFAVMSKLALEDELVSRRTKPRRFTPLRMGALAASLLFIAGLGILAAPRGSSKAAAPAAAAAGDTEMVLFAVAEESVEEAAAQESPAEFEAKEAEFGIALTEAAPEEPAANDSMADCAAAARFDPAAAAIAWAEAGGIALADTEPLVTELAADELPDWESCLDSAYTPGELSYLVQLETAAGGELALLLDEAGVVYGRVSG